MMRIPFTKIKVSWKLPGLLLLFMAISSSWQRGLLAFVVLFGGIWLLCMALWRPFTWLMYSEKRHPGESLRELAVRMREELDKHDASREQERNRYSYYAKYRYVTLDCGHIVFEYFPDEVPQEGSTFWCWGHRKHGPAQEQTVVHIDRWPPVDRKEVLM